MRTISPKLPDALIDEPKLASKARKTTKSSLIRESLELTLRAKPSGGVPSCYDLASDLGDKLKGAPKDLADNRKYMDGFGD